MGSAPTTIALSPLDQLPDSLKRTVQLFKAWADQNPANAAQETLSLHELFRQLEPLMRTLEPIAGAQFVTRSAAAVHLKVGNTRNQPWWALCYWALQLYDDADTAPAALRYFAGEYAKRLEWPTPTMPPGCDASDIAQPDAGKLIVKLKQQIKSYVDQGPEADLSGMASAAGQLAALMFNTLNQTSGDDASHALDETATRTAESLCNLTHVLTTRLDAAEDQEITDDMRRCCALVFDAAIHAHRRLARTPGREANELGRLATLRERDRRITEPIRFNGEQAFMRYHGDHSGALLRDPGQQQLRAEIAAAERLTTKLAALKAAAPAKTFRVLHLNGQRPAANDVVDIDRLVGVACRLACAMTCAPDVDPSVQEKFRELRRKLLNLFPKGHERNDVRWLLTLAAGPSDAIFGASEVLRVARLRGIGDYLLARMFVAASTTDEAVVDIRHRSHYRLFHPRDEDLLRRVAVNQQPWPGEDDAAFLLYLREQRRAVILQRAAGLYERAVSWLREAGSAGQLRSRAQTELADITVRLNDWPMNRDPSSVVHALSGLRHRLHEMTIDGFLWADIDAWTNMNDDTMALSARRLSAVLDQTQRYLNQPEFGTVAET
ncbi:hypothetical protein A7G45_08150 [Mycolicibacterium llatzerense]|nr:hypothetical protein [Mycolicibacterium llatzerense]